MVEQNVFLVSKSSKCGVILYDRFSGKELERIPFTEEERSGICYHKRLNLQNWENVSYLFYEDEKIFADPNARSFCGKCTYGQKRDIMDYRAVFTKNEFDWGGDKRPYHPYKDMLCYCLHVRGFTMDKSSCVTHRGTFRGLLEKIPYLKDIGVTTLELQPAYEFEEGAAEDRLNYWGYTKGFYYAPKAAYCASDDVVNEFKTFVKVLHDNGLELVMQFYFPAGVKAFEMLDILRFWATEYHVDGFHLMGEGILADCLAEDAILADCKLWYYGFDAQRLYDRREQPSFPQLAEYNDSWYYDMRRFLRGDESTLEGVMYQMRHIPGKMGHIHYLTNYSGFTLYDMVAYDYKHNEKNGEHNRDGSDYNCSWNCGAEGETEDEAVNRLRIRQIKNAMCLLMFSQSTPLIFMGDEFGNTQFGNNNPYCQDNETAWLDWSRQEKNAVIFRFWKELVRFRRENTMLHPETELKMMDYLGVGYPDLSFHGIEAWRPRTEPFHRQLGMMLCGKYAARKPGGDVNQDAGRTEKSAGMIYIAMNMYRNSCEMGLPKAPEGKQWKLVITTMAHDENDTFEISKGLSNEMENCKRGYTVKIAPECIAVYIIE